MARRSTFYRDGYHDRACGLPISPPDVNIYKNEYLNGYRDCCKDVADAPMSHPLNPLSDADYSAELVSLEIALTAIRKAHLKFSEAANGAATSQTRDMLHDHALQLTDMLGDLNGQRALVREAHLAPMAEMERT